ERVARGLALGPIEAVAIEAGAIAGTDQAVRAAGLEWVRCDFRHRAAVELVDVGVGGDQAEAPELAVRAPGDDVAGAAGDRHAHDRRGAPAADLGGDTISKAHQVAVHPARAARPLGAVP